MAVILALFLIVSCRQNEQNEFVSDEFRTDLSSRTEFEQKEIFKNLDTNTKLRLWKNKLDQIKNEDISNEQRVLIDNISSELSKIKDTDFDGQKLFEYAIKMAQITPEDEFLKMFSSLSDYKRNEISYKNFLSNSAKNTSFKSNVETDLIDYLSKIKEGKSKAELYKNKEVSLTAKKPVCNCKWTCSFYGPTNDNCIPSTGGCGLLWLQECNGHVGIS